MRTEPVIRSEAQQKEAEALWEKIKEKTALALVLASAIGFFFKLLFF